MNAALVEALFHTISEGQGVVANVKERMFMISNIEGKIMVEDVTNFNYEVGKIFNIEGNYGTH